MEAVCLLSGVVLSRHYAEKATPEHVRGMLFPHAALNSDLPRKTKGLGISFFAVRQLSPSREGKESLRQPGQNVD
jgi:hypothetical protein